MGQLNLVAIVTAKEAQKAFVKEEIQKLIPITREEKGCLHYHLFVDNKKPNRFVLEEEWETHAMWQDHMNSPHMQNYSKVTKDAVDDWELIELTRLD